MSTTPGSCTLWSVHSGHWRCTMRFASSTSSWKRRSSRFGAGNGMSAFLGDHIEREHEVAGIVGSAARVGNIDIEQRVISVIDGDLDADDVDARLPPQQRLPHLIGDLTGDVVVDTGEHKIVNHTAELGTHRPFTPSRTDDQPY